MNRFQQIKGKPGKFLDTLTSNVVSATAWSIRDRIGQSRSSCGCSACCANDHVRSHPDPCNMAAEIFRQLPEYNFSAEDS